jgi:beta-lactamase superfamily II metal-dependent hydrolase
MPTVVYGDKPETILRKHPAKKASAINHVLLGTYLEVLDEEGDWYLVATRRSGPGGWVHRDDVRDDPCLKVFFVDVAQGDGALIEYPGGIMLIDGGPTAKFHAFLRHRYQPLIKSGTTIHIDSLVISHPDADHYTGFINLLADESFSFGKIYHNGIKRYSGTNLPPDADFDLGKVQAKHVNGRKEHVLVETFSSLDDVRSMVESGEFLTKAGKHTIFLKFWMAALDAADAGRLKGSQRITSRDRTLPGHAKDEPGALYIEVLAPVPTRSTGRIEYVTFPDTNDIKPFRHGDEDPPRASSSHTRNGHSVVLKLKFGKHTFLFGGDLNVPAQLHLMEHYGNDNPFGADVAKACHHGSSDFFVDFLKRVRPCVNVISSGDNKSFDHPVADAIGALAHHTTGDFPLFFSTELARAVSGENIHYGLINARSNGKVLTMAQMKEQHRHKADVWDSFTVPWKGRFHDLLTEEQPQTARLI